jgi:hypothetical protein
MDHRLWFRALSLATIAAGLPLAAQAGPRDHKSEHVPLISIDGMHAADFQYRVGQMRSMQFGRRAPRCCPTSSRDAFRGPRRGGGPLWPAAAQRHAMLRPTDRDSR